jgi:hypothetical protein
MGRFVLSMGLYPNIAVRKAKRNCFRVYKISKVRLASQSCLFQSHEGEKTHGDDDETEDGATDGGDDIDEQTRPPRFYVFEELADTGDKTIRRVTAIDPLFLVLSAERVQIENDHGERVCLRIDDFIGLMLPQTEASFLLELRALWQKILAVGIPLAVQGQRHPAVIQSLDLIRQFVQTESSMWR